MSKEILEGVVEVSWTGGPLEDEHMDEFGMSVKLPNEPGRHLVFPAIQGCKKGESRWAEVEIKDHAGHEGKLPAPILVLETQNGEAGHK